MTLRALLMSPPPVESSGHVWVPWQADGAGVRWLSHEMTKSEDGMEIEDTSACKAGARVDE